MTEKRFWLVPLDYYGEQRFVRDNNQIGEKSLSNEEVVECLNNLHEENQQLRKENKALKDANEGLIGTIAHFELGDLEW